MRDMGYVMPRLPSKRMRAVTLGDSGAVGCAWSDNRELPDKFLQQSSQRYRLFYFLFRWLALGHMRTSIPKLVGSLKSTKALCNKRPQLFVFCAFLQICSKRVNVVCVFFALEA